MARKRKPKDVQTEVVTLQKTKGADMSYAWCIGGGLLQVPVIEAIRECGFGVIVSDANPDCVCAPKADLFFRADIFNIEDHIKIGADYKGKVLAVICAGIDAIVTQAELAKYLGVAGIDPDMARMIHNKASFREAMKMLGYPTPDFILLNEKTHWLDFVREHDRFIIKNTDNSASRGTRIMGRNNNQLEIERQIEMAQRSSRSGIAIMESVFTGTEHTVETIIDANGFHPCFITDRHFDYTDGYTMETGLRHPSVLPEYIQRKAYSIAQNLAYDLGINIGAFKLDIMVTDEGIRILEATTRLSGGYDCQYVVPLATGKNIVKAIVETHLFGKFNPDYLVPKHNKVVLTGSNFPKPGKVIAINGIKTAKKYADQVFIRKDVGNTVEPYIDCGKRVNFVIASGGTESEAKDKLQNALNSIEVITE
jgi:biotin carboxylase